MHDVTLVILNSLRIHLGRVSSDGCSSRKGPLQRNS